MVIFKFFTGVISYEDKKISFVCGLGGFDNFKGKLTTYLVSLTMISFDATLLVQHKIFTRIGLFTKAVERDTRK